MVLYTCRKFIIKLISIDFSVLVSGLCSLLYPKEQPYSSGEEVRETSCGQLWMLGLFLTSQIQDLSSHLRIFSGGGGPERLVRRKKKKKRAE